ncbi:MAG: hypothetical protein ABR987_02590 [Terracidiphilus sp.]|jgi:hypothetical protein
MTVCVAALAAAGRAIVCIADKALSYGDYIQWDSDSSKIITLNPSGSLVMVSGDEEPVSRVLAHLTAVGGDIGGKPLADTILLVEQQYAKAVDELVFAKLIRPRQLTRDEYIRALTAPGENHIIRALADEVSRFSLECTVLVCGFDDRDEAFILSVGTPGVAINMTGTGFHAIGSGWDKAVSKLLFAEHKRDHDIDRVLYDAFDAKANAEMAIGVGYEWDATLVLGGTYGSQDVPKTIKELLEKVWSKYNRSPFEKFDPKEHWSIPKNWRKQLWEYCYSNVVERMKAHVGTIPPTLELIDFSVKNSAKPSDSQTSEGPQ